MVEELGAQGLTLGGVPGTLMMKYSQTTLGRCRAERVQIYYLYFLMYYLLGSTCPNYKGNFTWHKVRRNWILATSSTYLRGDSVFP